MSLKVVVAVVVVGVVGVVVGDRAPVYPYPSYAAPPTYEPPPRPRPSYKEPEYPTVPPQYSYEYDVSDHYSGANFAASESRDGYRTEGRYTVDLPDGRKQIVNYVDHGDGLLAEVSYEGEAQYPDHHPSPYKPAPPVYKPPQPSYKPTPGYYS